MTSYTGTKEGKKNNKSVAFAAFVLGILVGGSAVWAVNSPSGGEQVLGPDSPPPEEAPKTPPVVQQEARVWDIDLVDLGRENKAMNVPEGNTTLKIKLDASADLLSLRCGYHKCNFCPEGGNCTGSTGRAICLPTHQSEEGGLRFLNLTVDSAGRNLLTLGWSVYDIHDCKSS